MALIQVDPDVLLDTCGGDPSFICREVLERTDSRSLAEAADIVFARPLTIVVVVVVAWVVARVLRRLVDRFVATLAGQGRGSARSSARAETLGHVLHSVAGFSVWTIAGLTVLGEIGINLGPLVAGAGIAGVALGFGAQSLVKDVLAGIFVLIEDQYGVGDVIDAGELGGPAVRGTVESVSLRATRLRADDGTMWHVPNGTILRVGNLGRGAGPAPGPT